MSVDPKLELIEKIKSISNNESFKIEVSQIRAKTLLKEMGHNPNYSWKYVESRVARNALAASFMLEILSLDDIKFLEEMDNSPLRLAFIWESLGRLGEKTNRTKALINAAITYELSGFQANAACLSKQIHKNFVMDENPSVEVLSCLFLQRLFLKLKLIINNFNAKKPDLQDKYSVIISSAFSLAGKGFFNASEYFLSGNNELLENAKKDFTVCEKIFSEFGFVEEYNMIRSIRSLLPVMQSRSIWNILSSVVPENPRWGRYLKLLSRGIGSNILQSSSISELWPSQIYALKRGLLDQQSKIIKMPTSAGKTRVAELAIVHTLVTTPGAKCVYIAPYRSLVWELEQVFLNIFGDLGFKVSSVIGSYEMDELEEQLIIDADILVMTPEKLDLLQRAKSEFLNNVKLFIMDEGQMINEDRRGIKFELLLTRLKRKLTHAHFIFLSAVVSNVTLEQFAKWFNTDRTNIIESQWRPSIQRYAKFYWKKDSGFIRFVDNDDNPLLEEFIPGVIKKREYEFVNPKSGRINRKYFPEIENRSHTAAELAYKFSEHGPILVFCAQSNFVESVAKSLQTRLILTKNIEEQVPGYFQAVKPSRSIKIAEDWLGKDHMVTQLLKNGIAVHHGNLPEAVRKAVEADFRDRVFRIIVATNTLAQGINLPIKTVIIHTCRRRNITSGEWERIPDRDYWNIAGRAGRAGEETEGAVIHMIANEEDKDDFEYYLERRNDLEPIKSALFKLLQDISEERLSEEALKSKLDPEILALMVEESIENNFQPLVEIIDDSLVKQQAQKANINISYLYDAFNQIANTIKINIPKEHWKTYSSTGLSTSSCESLRSYIAENYQSFYNFFKDATYENSESFIKTLLSILRTLPEMKSDREYDGDYGELLIGWLSGKGSHTLSKEQGGKDANNVAKFIEDFFSYRLPWGISSFIKIATDAMKLEPADISDYVKFLPTMIKFGVPFPEASWAMSAGIPMRELAIDLAIRYKNEIEDLNHHSFLEWIGKISSDTLRLDFKLENPVLEDVSRSLFRNNVNPYLKNSRNLSEVLLEEQWIAGIRFEDRPLVAKGAKINQTVELIRDYDNPVDRNAIQVLLNQKILGFLDKQLAQFLAPNIDSGLKLIGKIVKISNDKIPQIKIRMYSKSVDVAI